MLFRSITGNAGFDIDQFYGSTPQYQFAEYGDSFLRLQPNLTFQHYNSNYPPDQSSFTFHNQDFFSPSDQATLNSRDADVGSGGLMLLPDDVGSTNHPHLLIGCGKEGKIYLLDRDDLGGFNLSADNVVQEFNSEGAFSSPAYWNNAIYYQGDNGSLKRFPISNGVVDTNSVTQSSDSTDFGCTPTISANGSTNGIVWTLESGGFATNSPAILRAHNALDTATELYNSTQLLVRDNPGIACKFTRPVVANGRVYTATQNQVSVYGLGAMPVVGAPTISYSGSGYAGDTITLTDATPGASIYYTLDGSTPTASSHLYTAPFVLQVNGTMQVKAFLTSYVDSAITSRFFGLRGTDGHGDGLKGVYFHGINLDPSDPGGTPVAQVDPLIDFSKPNFPIPFDPQDNFSVRWTGQVQPRFDDVYTFTTVSDDGVRLWVNGQKLIDDWTPHGPTTDVGTITLQGNQHYNIVLEFFQAGGGADAHLSWSSASQEPQIIPQTQLYSGAPDAPTGLTAASGTGQILLAWTGTPGAATYSVYRGTTAGGENTTAVATGLTVATYSDPKVTLGQTYFYTVSATNTGGESLHSAEASAVPGYPIPTITTLSPGSAPVTAPSVRLTLTGTQFVPGMSVVHWNSNGQDTPLVTVCTSTTQATATVPGALLQPAGTVQVTVVNPAPGGGVSSPIAFTTGTPHLTANMTLFRNKLGQVAGTLTVQNTGTIDLNTVFMRTASLGRALGIGRPATFGALPAGASKITTVIYPTVSNPAGASASLRLFITYDGGSIAHNAIVVLP